MIFCKGIHSSNDILNIPSDSSVTKMAASYFSFCINLTHELYKKSSIDNITYFLRNAKRNINFVLMNFCLKSDLKISDNYKLLNSILNIQHYEKLFMFMYSGIDAISYHFG